MAELSSTNSPNRFAMGRRQMLGVTAMGAIGVLVAACGQSTPAVPAVVPTTAPADKTAAGAQPTQASPQAAVKSDAANSKEKVKVRISGWQSAPVEGDIMLGQAKRFTDEVDPNVEVEPQLLPRAQYVEKVLTMMASGTAPDVLQFTPDEFPDYASRGALRSLTPFISQDKQFDLSIYWDQHVKAYQWKQQQGGIPIYNSPYVMFYNKTLFDKAGLQVPDDTWSWDKEMIEAGKALTKEGQFGFGFDTGMGRVSGKFWGDGADIFNEDRTASNFDSPEAIQAIQEYADLRLVHKIAPLPGQTGDMGNDDMFATGRIAMYITGQFVVGNLIKTKKDFEFDIALQPKGKKKRLARLGGGCYAITSDSKIPDTAWKLIKWQAGDTVQRAWAKAGLQPPAIKALGESPDYLNVRPPEHIKTFVDMTNYSQLMYPGLPGTDEWNRIVTSTLDPVWLGTSKASQVLPELKKKLDTFLQGQKRDAWKPLK